MLKLLGLLLELLGLLLELHRLIEGINVLLSWVRLVKLMELLFVRAILEHLHALSRLSVILQQWDFIIQSWVRHYLAESKLRDFPSLVRKLVRIIATLLGSPLFVLILWGYLGWWIDLADLPVVEMRVYVKSLVALDLGLDQVVLLTAQNVLAKVRPLRTSSLRDPHLCSRETLNVDLIMNWHVVQRIVRVF